MELEITGLHQVEQMANFWDIWFPRRALGLTGEAIVEDTRLRLEDDETAPDGSRWAPWSDNPPGQGYASTRGPEHKLLFASGDLSRSIEADQKGARLDVGSALDYALVHQFGSTDGTTKSRPYVGISSELDAALNDIYIADFDGGWLALRA